MSYEGSEREGKLKRAKNNENQREEGEGKRSEHIRLEDVQIIRVRRGGSSGAHTTRRSLY